MGEVISVSMNKGGVGKTSLVTNIAAAVSAKHPDKRTLIIDTDPQGHASLAFGRRGETIDDSTYNVLIDRMPIADVTVKLADNLDLVAANHDLDDFEVDMLGVNVPDKNRLLATAIESVRDRYDYIFIDTPPSRGPLAVNVIFAADRIIIPFVPETFAVEGLLSIYDKIRTYKLPANPQVNVVGTMVDSRLSLHAQLLPQARQFCVKNGIHMFDTVIPRAARVANATAYEQKPAVWSSDRNNAVVKAYYDLLEEIENAAKTTA